MSEKCQWAIDNNISDPACHKDFCACIRLSMSESKARGKARNWASYERFIKRLVKANIPFERRENMQMLFVKDKIYVHPAHNWIRYKGKEKRYYFKTKDSLFDFLSVQ